MLSGSDGIGPLPLGSPAEAGEGCPRHVVVLWPRLSPHPQPCPSLDSHTGITYAIIYSDRCGRSWTESPWPWGCANLPPSHPGAPMAGHLLSSGLAPMGERAGDSHDQ